MLGCFSISTTLIASSTFNSLCQRSLIYEIHNIHTQYHVIMIVRITPYMQLRYSVIFFIATGIHLITTQRNTRMDPLGVLYMKKFPGLLQKKVCGEETKYGRHYIVAE